MPAKYLGRCWACEYDPVAFDAPVCPRCGVKNPNPSRGERYAKRGLLIGFQFGSLAGGVVMAITTDRDPVTGFIAGAILGTLPGLIAGLFVGKFVGSVLGDAPASDDFTDHRSDDDRYTE